jgi:hypothetical protein
MVGLNANPSNPTLTIGNPNSMERRINPNRGPVVRIPVDSSGQFGQFPTQDQRKPSQNISMGVPTFGNVGAFG